METDISDTSTTHRHVSQISQTDWDFLRCRAQEIGFEIGVAQGKFFFREASSAKPKGGSGGPSVGRSPARRQPARRRAADADVPAEPAVVPAAAQRGQHPDRRRGPRLRLQEGRGRRRHRAAEDRHGQARRRSGSRSARRIVHRVARSRSRRCRRSPGCPALGLMPSMTARVVSNRPLDWGSPTSSAVDEMAKGVAEHLASTILEAEGTAYGNPGIQAGKKIKIAGVAEEFVGEWIVTAARHVFESEVGGYSTYFEVSGRHDRTLLGLASLGSASVRPATITRQRDRRRHQQQRPRRRWAGSSSASRGWRRSTRATGRGSCRSAWARSGATCSCPRSATRCSSGSSSATPAGRT